MPHVVEENLLLVKYRRSSSFAGGDFVKHFIQDSGDDDRPDSRQAGDLDRAPRGAGAAGDWQAQYRKQGLQFGCQLFGINLVALEATHWPLAFALGVQALDQLLQFEDVGWRFDNDPVCWSQRSVTVAPSVINGFKG